MSTFFYAFPHNCESSRSYILSPPRQLIDCRVFIKSLWSDGPWQLAPSYNLCGLNGLRFSLCGANVSGGRTMNFLTVAVAFFFSSEPTWCQCSPSTTEDLCDFFCFAHWIIKIQFYKLWHSLSFQLPNPRHSNRASACFWLSKNPSCCFVRLSLLVGKCYNIFS